jgi:SAM-dependent methyltransferase
MRAYWDEGARRNAVWYVDTSLDYDEPDLERFFETGRVIVGQALDDAPVHPPGRGLAVEIGCGLGRICQGLAERFDRVVGVDISPEMLKQAREHVQDPKVEFVLGDGVSLGALETGSADLVLSFTVFQHIPSVKVICDYLTEAGRVLKPGGVFVFQWNNEPGALRWRVRRAVLSTLQRTGVRRETHDRNAPEFLGSRVPLDEIEPALQRGGLALKGVRGEDTLFAWAWAQRQA